MECNKPVVIVVDGKKYRLVPLRVWELGPRRKEARLIKIGLFRLPDNGKTVKRRVPDDYPNCG